MRFGRQREARSLIEMEPTSNAVVPAHVELYSTLGYRPLRGSCWRVMIQGRVSSHGQLTLGKRLMLKGLCRALNSGQLNQAPISSEIFQKRVAGFLANSHVGHRPLIQIGESTYRLRRKSKGSGLFTGKLDLDPDEFANLRVGSFTILNLQCLLEDQSSSCNAQAYLAEPRGLSVVSDIDDTIKRTYVTSRKEMLHATFLRPFEAILGMSSLYQAWSRQGAMFHYVSSSPWQIYEPLHEFLDTFGFPGGSMHLRWFRLRDEMFKRWRIMRRKSKGGLIATMIKRLPQRDFVLVGDSGERDPEIYAKLASRYTSVKLILIRDLDERPMDAIRMARIRRQIGPTPIVLFREPREIENALEICTRS